MIKEYLMSMLIGHWHCISKSNYIYWRIEWYETMTKKRLINLVNLKYELYIKTKSPSK